MASELTPSLPHLCGLTCLLDFGSGLFIFTLYGIFKHCLENFLMNTVFRSFPLFSPLHLYPVSPSKFISSLSITVTFLCRKCIYKHCLLDTVSGAHIFLNWFHENLSAWRRRIGMENCHLVGRMPQVLEWVQLAAIFHSVHLYSSIALNKGSQSLVSL